MTTVEIVMAVVMFAIAGLWLFLGIRSFMERGFLLNNAYIYATKEERKTMDKKPYYRQSAVAFCLLPFERYVCDHRFICSFPKRYNHVACHTVCRCRCPIRSRVYCFAA